MEVFLKFVYQAMESAGKRFIGEHDFRNFCKMDATNVHNYRRYITSFEIFSCNERFKSNPEPSSKFHSNLACYRLQNISGTNLDSLSTTQKKILTA